MEIKFPGDQNNENNFLVRHRRPSSIFIDSKLNFELMSVRKCVEMLIKKNGTQLSPTLIILVSFDPP